MADKQVGFECEFIEKPPKAFQSECPVCLLVLREPYQATCCGYSFCRVCIERITARNLSCPCCKAEEFDHYPNKGLQRSLNGFQVKCTNKQQDCQWEGELGQLDNHLNYNPTEDKQLEGCQFTEIKCLHCLMHSLRSDIRIHQREKCPSRPFSCQYCDDFNSSYENVTTNHWPVCSYYPLPCPNKCGKTLQCKSLDSHITNDCPLTIIDCDFRHVGCEVRLPRKDMPAHIKEGVVRHVSLQAVSYKQVVTNMARLQEENKLLKQEVAKLTQDLTMYKVYTPLCPVEFTMTNFAQKRNNRDIWESSPFYTYLKGYKMSLFVYANGSGRAEGEYISVCLKLMKGEFDDQLSWPFRGQVEIQLLNQDQDEGHHVRIVTFRESHVQDAGDRVKDGEESELMIGKKQFISHGDLRVKYLKNDCLAFRIKIV